LSIKWVFLMDLRELSSLLLSWIVISFLFSAYYLFYDTSIFPLVFILYAVAAGAGFLLHEIAHRDVAQHFGCKAYYRIWPWGLVISLALSLFGAYTGTLFVFATLGAVYIVPMALTSSTDFQAMKRINGIISLAGPLMNLALAAFFCLLYLVGGMSLWGALGQLGLQINVWLAAFNLLPFPPLDGSKVFAWSKIAWAVIGIGSWAALICVYSLIA
jgi:Zn-dependent protease